MTGRLPTELPHRGLTLLAERAVWQESARTLWVADVHLGKSAAYRALGQPVPAGATQENLGRLSALIESRGASRLVVLGDLFHARAAYTPALVEACLEWRTRHSDLEMVLVLGNHDLRAGSPPADLRIEATREPFVSGRIVGRHHPLPAGDAIENDGATVLAGHIHPTTRLHGPGRDSMRFPCFLLQGHQIVLPAFGEFTGGARVEWPQSAQACAVTEAGLIAMGPRGRRVGEPR